LTSENVTQRIEQFHAGTTTPKEASQSAATFTLDDHRALLVRAENNHPRLADDLSDQLSRPQCFIEIPHNINRLKESSPGLGQLWREATRTAFLAAIDSGFTIRNFCQLTDGESQRQCYVLAR
jgi:predicted GNAT superfamily acetyltransferase